MLWIQLGLLVLFIFIIPALSSYAQFVPATSGGGGPSTIDLGEPPEVPIDGGLTTVLAIGVGYGAKKIRDYRKKK
jgi:hypothetical protein